MSVSPPTGTVTFLYTDVEDSTGLAQKFPEELPALLAQHHSILRHSIEANHGHIFRFMGDAFCAAFYTATDAVLAAVQAQHQLQEATWQPVDLRVRMGIHTGPAQAGGVEGEPGEYAGYLTLTRAQRVMSTAFGGQILLSSPSAELVQGELPEDVELRDLGDHRLKGLLNPEHLWQIVATELLSEFPALPSLNAIPNNLPIQLSSFIGREQTVAEAVSLLETARLLTLTGVGGVGKTRLSLQAAAETMDAFPDGVWFVELAPLADPALLLQSVASVLGLNDLTGRPLAVALVDYLRAKEALLLMDNCEHLIDACAGLAQDLLTACPRLRILASSREALGLTGETILQIPSLAVPPLDLGASLEDLSRFEAVQLFLERARAAQPGFLLTEQNAPVVAQICQRLDGIPLAIELAAVRTKMFSAEQILNRLDDRFRLLTGGSRTALPRQQTLRALIDWSYDLLPDEEQVILRRLSIFAGGWTYEAAEAVLGQEGEDTLDLLDSLAHLIEKSLVLVDESPDGGEARYLFLETIRQYANEKLLQSGEAARLRDCHLDFFVKFTEETEPKLLSNDQLFWLDRLEADHENLRAALAWALENRPEAALQLAGAVWNFWAMRGYAEEGRRWLVAALDQVEANSALARHSSSREIAARAKAHMGLGALMMGQGDSAGAWDALQESATLARQAGEKRILATALSTQSIAESFLGRPVLSDLPYKEGMELAREIGENWLLARALGGLAAISWIQGDIKASNAYLQESLGLIQEAGDPWSNAMMLMRLGLGLVQLGEFAEARARFEKAMDVFRQIGDKYRINMIQSELAHLERRQGNLEQALAFYRETILSWQNLGHRAAIANQLECFAFIAAAQGNDRQAALLFGAAEALREEIRSPMTLFERGAYEAEVVSLHARMEETAFMETWAQGRLLSMEEAIARALEGIPGT